MQKQPNIAPFIKKKAVSIMLKVTAQQMKNIDHLAQEKFFIPGIILMENAGLRAAEAAVSLLKRRKDKRIFIFCGPGNNGGDGFVVARHLINNDIKVLVFLLAESQKLKGDALINYNILVKMKAPVIEFANIFHLKNAKQTLKKAGLIIDAIFGIGLNKNIEGGFEKIIDLINQSGVPVLSLDTPSGLCATTGKILKTCIKAHTTVTFAAAKKGFFIKQGPDKTGKLLIADISMPRGLLRHRKTIH
ncbi:MAG: NAD(P)H-hydrate epimerase [Candidatus Omnitrophota bacterium]|nr:MAG: NAD(P)H-hydrate epimerase [Candidatus Omnitrophota bacterium]